MQRKTKLIRKILEHVEREQTNGPVGPPEFDDYPAIEVHYHVGLCVEAGYIVADAPGLYDGQRVFSAIHRLTWEGHEALDRLRREGCGS